MRINNLNHRKMRPKVDLVLNFFSVFLSEFFPNYSRIYSVFFNHLLTDLSKTENVLNVLWSVWRAWISWVIFCRTNSFIEDILIDFAQKITFGMVSLSQGINFFGRDHSRAKRLHLPGRLLNKHFALKTLKIVRGNLHM